MTHRGNKQARITVPVRLPVRTRRIPVDLRRAPGTGFSAATLVSVLVVLLLGLSSTVAARETRPARSWLAGTVMHVYDGDSFRLRTSDGRIVGVRLAGIDAPERSQPWAGVSRRALQKAIDRRRVRLSVVKTDVYGRLVAFVYVDSTDIGLQLVSDGLAWHFTRYDSDLEPTERNDYAAAQAAARAGRAGLWQQRDPLAPWTFRQQQRRHRRRSTHDAAGTWPAPRRTRNSRTRADERFTRSQNVRSNQPRPEGSSGSVRARRKAQPYGFIWRAFATLICQHNGRFLAGRTGVDDCFTRSQATGVLPRWRTVSYSTIPAVTETFRLAT